MSGPVGFLIMEQCKYPIALSVDITLHCYVNSILIISK